MASEVKLSEKQVEAISEIHRGIQELQANQENMVRFLLAGMDLEMERWHLEQREDGVYIVEGPPPQQQAAPNRAARRSSKKKKE